MPDSTLTAIRTKVRRLTRSPSTAQISDAQIDEYVNTFVVYDFPEQIRLSALRTVLTFYTQPGVDVYETSTDPNNALYDFKNRYVAVHPPIYLAGIQGFYTQWRDVFYGYYPQTNTIAQTGLFGDGATTTFSGTVVARPMLQRNVIFTAVDGSGTSMVLIDYPSSTSNTTGALGLPNQPQTLPSPYGQINYLTGAFTVNFPLAPAAQAPIIVENIAYQPGKPLAMLYYDQKFTIRPVPDKSYAVSIEADIRPTELLNTPGLDKPQLSQWWQYIAFGAAKKIFEDRMDMDSVQLILPEFKMQERLCLRATLTQQANERTVTIYTQGKNYGFGWFGTGGWPY